MRNDALDLASSSVLAVSPQATLQDLGGDEGGVALRLDTGEMYILNDTALEFARRLDGKRTIGEVAAMLATIFEADPAVLLADMVEVATDMVGESVLVVLG